MLNKLWQKKQRPPPEPDSSKEELLLEARLKELKSSPYANYISQLTKKISGKTVESTIGGSSGFILHFSDRSWVAAYLENDQLHYWFGEGESPSALAELINSPDYGETGDIAAEVVGARGHTVIGLSIGLNCFSFCFKENRALDTFIVPTPSRKPGLRVCWTPC